MFSAKTGKVFVYLVKLYKRVFHPNVFSHMVNFSSPWGWESDWSPTGMSSELKDIRRVLNTA